MPINYDIEYPKLMKGYQERGRRIEELENELDNERAKGIHSCHQNCQRPMCVLRRDNECLQARVEALECEGAALCARDVDRFEQRIERLTAENERLLILKKACENWMDICGCCCESDTESLHDGTRITQLGIKDALDSLQDKNTSTSEQVQVSLTS